MRYSLILALLVAGAAPAGCSPEFWGGTAVGVLGTGAGYEYNAKRQMDRLEEDYREGRVDRETYQERKRQIERGSIIY
ncbi:MAG TPA: hypothetical protein VNN77_08505 [candidate division Zixibacteria bacterium]|nr:hypothetical protein [candidate division Zixibacteria bacterium]